MLKALYGSMKIRTNMDIILLPFKIVYIIFTFPFLIFILLALFRSLGGFGNPLTEEYKGSKKFFLHFAAVGLSFMLWIFTLSALNGNVFHWF